MDPIKESAKIFKALHQKIGKDIITDTHELEHFLNLLLKETKGLVIVDFLDAANWDSIDNFEIDHDTRRVHINWHDYRNKEESRGDKIMRSMFLPADVYGILFDFQELHLLNLGEFSIFTFRGYAVSARDVIKIMSNGAEEFKVVDDSDNFSVETVSRVNSHWKCYHFLNTPIFSSVIIPKNLNISAALSRRLLFAYNLEIIEKRISRVEFGLSIDVIDLEIINEKSNTLRRIMENALKIELCYRYKQLEVKESYSNLLLGSLIKLVSTFRDDEQKRKLNTIVRLSNELSHDSGKRVTTDKALELLKLIREYSERLGLEISGNPYPHFDFGN